MNTAITAWLIWTRNYIGVLERKSCFHNGSWAMFIWIHKISESHQTPKMMCCILNTNLYKWRLRMTDIQRCTIFWVWRQDFLSTESIGSLKKNNQLIHGEQWNIWFKIIIWCFDVVFEYYIYSCIQAGAHPWPCTITWWRLASIAMLGFQTKMVRIYSPVEEVQSILRVTPGNEPKKSVPP